MKHAYASLILGGVLAGCSTPLPPHAPPVEIAERAAKKELEKPPTTTDDGTATAMTLADYKQFLAKRISEVNSVQVYAGRPQALLRSVIVAKFVIDRDGQLLRSELVRTNRDSVNEASVLRSIKNTAPFPKPRPSLLRNGRLEITETWLFNNDGRFQLRSIAQAQMDQ